MGIRAVVIAYIDMVIIIKIWSFMRAYRKPPEKSDHALLFMLF